MWPFNKKQSPRGPKRPDGARFVSRQTTRRVANWTTASAPVDAYLRGELTKIRARSREAFRINAHGKRYVQAIRSNIVGANGPMFQSQISKETGKQDVALRKAVEDVWKDWSRKENCDYLGELNFVEMMKLCATTAAQDGEFILRIRDEGKYRFQLEVIDPELLDVTYDVGRTEGGGTVRLGVERNASGRVIAYHFREAVYDQGKSYTTGKLYRVKADAIIHGFQRWWPAQSRGVPWMHAVLLDMKILESFDDSAMDAARAGAMAAFALTNKDTSVGETPFQGDEEDSDGNSVFNLESGQIIDFGDKQLSPIDPEYPSEFYPDFVAAQLRKISRGLGISYHTTSGDLSSVNFSSIRADMLEDRELYKDQQRWLESDLLLPVWDAVITNAVILGRIRSDGRTSEREVDYYLPVRIQHKRWAWIEPLKDVQANAMAVETNLKSRSQIIQEQGDDPDTVWDELAMEKEKLEEMGLMMEEEPEQPPAQNNSE